MRGVPVHLTILAVLGLLIGVGCVGYGIYDYTEQSAAIDSAVAVEASVTEAEITERVSRRGGISYRVDVEFTYEYDGTTYTSDRLYPTAISGGYDDESKAESVIEPYRTDGTITAYVDPSSPSNGFLLRQRSDSPQFFVGIGALLVGLLVLNAVGPRDAGRGTELRPSSEYEPTRYDTLFGSDRDRVNALSKRLIAAGVATLVTSLVVTVLFSLTSEQYAVQVGVSDPLGLAVAAVALSVLVLLGGLVLYLAWSFTEYRRLRERIAPPRPPSPFKQPTRLVTIVAISRSWDELDQYGKRVALTVFTLGAALIIAWRVVDILLGAA